MKAIILAAGTGSRLRPMTDDRPKCLVELRGKPVLLHQLDALSACGIRQVEIVTGYRKDQIERAVADRAQCHDYPRYAETNNLHTLHHRRALLDADTIVMFADVLVPREAIRSLLSDTHDFTLLVDTSVVRADTMRVIIADGYVRDIGSHVTPAEGHGNFIGIARYTAKAAKMLAAELDAMVIEGGFENAYYTSALPRLSARGAQVYPLRIDGTPWLEIDSRREYEQACAADFYLDEGGDTV